MDRYWLVLGLGKSGKSAIKLLQKQNRAFLTFDDNKPEESVKEDAIPWEKIEHLILSPGIAMTHRLVQKAIGKNIPVSGEIAFALKECKQPCIAITGTNGKTTVTEGIEHILNASGLKAKALGNIGLPLAAYFAENTANEILVIELSSYQIETLSIKVFDLALLLNITPDHLDRYKEMQSYAKAKIGLQDCLKKNAPFFVYESVRSYEYLMQHPKFYGVDERLALHFPEYAEHDRENATAMWLAVSQFGVSFEKYLSALKTFKKGAHRIESVAFIKGVHYVNDSKGTNLDAVVKAVLSIKGDVILLAGGVDKGFSFALWPTLFKGKVKRAFVFGQAGQKIKEALKEGGCLVDKVDSLETAVELAAGFAKEGQTVLLSPGCSSFDQFRDYAHRGDVFKNCVKELQKL